ncbi:MAG: YjbH domain-containing protein, partial [Thermodesulfobacteriota bacterium]|nr:YjbH domain-containing protein [Thermodesulfobacteriota bacterium]
METPTARVMKEGGYRVGISNIDPYRYYYGAISPLKGLEIDGRITEVLGVPALTANYGNDKDKAIDLKYQFCAEGKYRPAIALGIMDPHGTRKYPSQYIVASKQIYPFDFTIGLGNGRFGKRPLPSEPKGIKLEIFSDTGGWLSDSQFFCGIQFAPSEKYAFMVEYSPIQYHKRTGDSAQKKYFQYPVPSKFNFGLRWKPFKWSEIDLSYQRGNQIGINFSVAFDLKTPMIPVYDHPYREKPEYRSTPLSERIARALYASGFSDIGVNKREDELWIDAQNDRYYYTPRAIGIILAIVADIVPDDIHDIHLILKDNGIPVAAFVTTREDVVDLYAEKLTFGEFFYLSDIGTDITETPGGKKTHRGFFDYGIKPSFQTFLNDPTGFFKYRLGVSAWSGFHPWRGASFIAGIEAYPLNTVSTSNKPLSIPVRSDIASYQEETVALERLMYDQIQKMKHNVYMRASAGLLEAQYAGLDGEIAMPVFDGRFMVGLSGSLVKKREPGEPLSLKNNPVKEHYTTAFFNARLNIPEQEISIDLKMGEFLAGDRGTRITISKFFNGVILSAWYSRTDTDIFSDQYNRGYHDKGIALTIPLRMFKGSDSKTSYKFGISPW